MITLRIIGWLLSGATALWTIAALCASVARDFKRRIPPAERIHRELWLPAGPGFLIDAVNIWSEGRFTWLIIFQALSMYWWWQMRDWPDDDDDTWTKRGRKLKARIGVILRGSRLTVGQVGA